ncbi:hypothetical protein FGO68_gene462 [Halteria grandinella]|uniref:Transmembrane protein n=1 Tax=Halteria grandinella TaxID=5974 RepID=A0A8J8T2L6_HALGN|nr:hypothetical protein FGO68_gene462 [Halteria grandinella]
MSYDLLEAVSNILQIVIYLFFIVASQKYINKGENSKLDAYLFATLVLVGLSVAVIQLDNVYYMISWGHSVPDSFDILVSGYPNQYFEKLGIFVDIARLSIVLIQLKNLQDPKRAIKRAQIYLGIASFILTALTIAIYLGYFLIDHIHMDDPTIGDLSQNSWELRIIVFTYSIYSNGGIIIAYFILYLKLRGVYDLMLVISDQSQSGMASHEEQDVMRQSLRSLLILFLSICQIYVFRIFRDFCLLLKLEFVEKVQPVFYICKTIMIFGLCYSIYKRLQLSQIPSNAKLVSNPSMLENTSSPKMMTTGRSVDYSSSLRMKMNPLSQSLIEQLNQRQLKGSFLDNIDDSNDESYNKNNPRGLFDSSRILFEPLHSGGMYTSCTLRDTTQFGKKDGSDAFQNINKTTFNSTSQASSQSKNRDILPKDDKSIAARNNSISQKQTSMKRKQMKTENISFKKVDRVSQQSINGRNNINQDTFFANLKGAAQQPPDQI